MAAFERCIAGARDLPAMAEARADFLLAQPADPEVRTEVVKTMSRIDPAAYCIGAEAVWLADQRDRAINIHVPTLVICGEEDNPTPPVLSRELHLIPGARHEPMNGRDTSPTSSGRKTSTRSSAPPSSAASIREADAGQS